MNSTIREKMMKTLIALILALTVAICSAQTTAVKTSEKGLVTVSSRGSDVREVIHDLFTQQGKNYILDPNIRFTLFLSLKEVEFEDALNLIMKTSSLKADIDNGVYYVTKFVRTTATPKTEQKPPADTHNSQTTPPQTQNPAPKKGQLSQDVLKKRLTTKFTKIDLRELMADISRQTGVMIEINEKVPGYKIDAYLLNTSLKYALDQITGAANLKYRFTESFTIEIVTPEMASSGTETMKSKDHN